MTPTQKLERARNHFRRLESARTRQTSPNWREAVCVRDGFYVGRRLVGQSLSAVWFAEEDQLKVYDPEGNLHATFHGEDRFHGRDAFHEASGDRSADDSAFSTRRAA